MESFRYNKNGIHSEFLKTLLVGRIYSFGRRDLKLPKPQNNAEIKLLSKFLFGVELTVKFEYCNNLYKSMLKNFSLKEKRFFKLYRLENDMDYIPKNILPSNICRNRDDKKVLLSLRYFCDQKHDDYYDQKFNREVFNSSYETDSHFWLHTIGEIYCGGVGDVSYGQVEITSFKESKRILNIYQGDNNVRKSFKKKLDKLIEIDKTYEKFI